MQYKILLIITFLLIKETAFAQSNLSSPIFFYGPGLDGSIYQKAGIYADASNGLLLDAPLTSGYEKLPRKILPRYLPNPYQ